MSRVWHTLKWLSGTSWPLYATTVLGSNVAAAIAIMLFLRFLVPLPGFKDFSSPTVSLGLIGLIYLVLAVLFGGIVTFILFRPVLDWQRHPDRHDPNMVRNLVMRIPFYQAALCAMVWAIGIFIVAIAARCRGRG